MIDDALTGLDLDAGVLSWAKRIQAGTVRHMRSYSETEPTAKSVFGDCGPVARKTRSDCRIGASLRKQAGAFKSRPEHDAAKVFCAKRVFGEITFTPICKRVTIERAFCVVYFDQGQSYPVRDIGNDCDKALTIAGALGLQKRGQIKVVKS